MKNIKNKSINLLYYKFNPQRQRRRNIIEYSLYIMFVCLFITGTVFIYSQNQKELATLKEINDDIKVKYEALSELEVEDDIEESNDFYRLEERKNTLSKLNNEREEFTTIVQEIYLTTQSEIIIESLGIKKNEILITAYTKKQAELIKFINRLEDNPNVKKVKDINSQLIEGSDELFFTLTLEWEGVS